MADPSEYAGSVVQNGKFAGYWDIDDELGRESYSLLYHVGRS